MRAQYLQGWLADAATPLSWRLDKKQAGSGALGDIGSHIVDLTQYLTGEHLTGVIGLLDTFVIKRPLPDGSGETGAVSVDDAAVTRPCPPWPPSPPTRPPSMPTPWA